MPTGKVLRLPRHDPTPRGNASARGNALAGRDQRLPLHRQYLPVIPQSDDQAHDLFIAQVVECIAVIAMLALGLGIVVTLL